MILNLIKFGGKIFFSSKEKHVLVLLQNNNELRGSGGFITQLLDIRTGKMKVSLQFKNDLNLKPKSVITPPKVVEKLLGLKHWFFRDSNVGASFQKAVPHILKNYESIFPDNKVTAIFAVNFSFLEELILITGEITINRQKVNCENLFRFMSTTVSDIDLHNLEALNSRKSIIRNLFNKLTKKLILSPWLWPKLNQFLTAKVQEKDLQMFFTDPKADNRIKHEVNAREFSLSGSNDFLAVVENNFLGLKSNRYIKRTIIREVIFFLDQRTLKLTDAHVQVQIKFLHAGGYDYPLSGDYQHHLRVYIPANATDVRIKSEISTQLMKENDLQFLEFDQIIRARSENTFAFTYRLPSTEFVDGVYKFKFIKQSGVKNEHLHETISFPEQFSVATLKGNLKIMESKVFHDLNHVSKDFSYALKAYPHRVAPRVWFHKITAAKRIEIYFNEPVRAATGGAPSISNVHISRAIDGKSVEIERIVMEQDNRHLVIIPKHPFTNYEEKFLTQIVDIVNICGTSTNPNPRTLTIINRVS